MSDYVMTGATTDELWPLVRDFHYSRRMPSAIQHCFALREVGGLFGDTGPVVAGAIFGLGANSRMPKQSIELTRLVRKSEVKCNLTQLVSFGLRWIRGNTLTTFCYSYADTAHGHHGGIYQAAGFTYVGQNKPQSSVFFADGTKPHKRSLSAKYGSAALEVVRMHHPDAYCGFEEPKHFYVFPLRQKWNTLKKIYGWERKPYPKPDAARPLDAPGTTGREAGATPAGRSNLSEN
jgi:hypothetical protein